MMRILKNIICVIVLYSTITLFILFLQKNDIITLRGDRMIFIKNNKVFLFLFLSFFSIILFLTYSLVKGEESVFYNWGNETSYTENTISYFNGNFNENRKTVELSWNVQLASSSIDKFEIYKDGSLLRQGKNASSAVLDLIESDLPTGNNKFDLIVTLKDNSTLNKSVYVYIDEAFDFEVTQKIVGSSIVYTVSYYYDDRVPVSAPQLSVYNVDAAIEVNFLSAKDDEKNGHLIKKVAEYEIRYDNVSVGRYEIDIQWEFLNYNIVENYNSTIDVAGDENVD